MGDYIHGAKILADEFVAEFSLSEVSERTLQQMKDWVIGRAEDLYWEGEAKGREAVRKVRQETWERAYREASGASFAGPEFEAGANLVSRAILKSANADGCKLSDPFCVKSDE